MIYKVGEHYDAAVNQADGIKFDLTDDGILLPIFMRNPTEKEIKNVESKAPVKMSFLSEDQFLIMFFKFGDLCWMDAPYNPHLSVLLTHLPDHVEPDMGFLTNILLFDTADGELKVQRVFSLRADLSKALIKEYKRIVETSYDESKYEERLMQLYRYSTDDLLSRTKRIYVIQ